MTTPTQPPAPEGVHAGEKLLPCPFCGHDAVQIPTRHHYWQHAIACGNCFCRTDKYADGHEEKMRADWNRRVAPPAPTIKARDAAERAARQIWDRLCETSGSNRSDWLANTTRIIRAETAALEARLREAEACLHGILANDGSRGRFAALQLSRWQFRAEQLLASTSGPATSPTCAWTYDAHHGKYDTACPDGPREFALTHGGPVENGYHHCPGCGRKVETTNAEKEGGK